MKTSKIIINDETHLEQGAGGNIVKLHLLATRESKTPRNLARKLELLVNNEIIKTFLPYNPNIKETFNISINESQPNMVIQLRDVKSGTTSNIKEILVQQTTKVSEVPKINQDANIVEIIKYFD